MVSEPNTRESFEGACGPLERPASDPVVSCGPGPEGLPLLLRCAKLADSHSDLLGNGRVRWFDGDVAVGRLVGYPHAGAMTPVVFPNTVPVDAANRAFKVDHSTTFKMDHQHCARLTS